MLEYESWFVVLSGGQEAVTDVAMVVGADKRLRNTGLGEMIHLMIESGSIGEVDNYGMIVK